MRAVRSLRPVPAVRRAHVQRRRQGAQGDAHADRDVLRVEAGAGDVGRTARRRRRSSSASRQLSDEPRADRRPASPGRSAEELIGGRARPLRRGPDADLRRRSRPRARRPSRLREALAADGVVASLMLIHDLYPVAARARGSRRRSTASGRTWSRTAATSSCSGSTRRGRADPARGQLRRLPGVGGDARAGDQAGARRARARTSTGSRSRARRRRAATRRRAERAIELPIVQRRPTATATAPRGRRAGRGGRRGLPVLVRARSGLADLGEGALPTTAAAGSDAAGRQRRRARCSPTATAARTAATPLGGTHPDRGRALPARAAAAVTTCRGPGARSTTTTCSSSPCRCCRENGVDPGRARRR